MHLDIGDALDDDILCLALGPDEADIFAASDDVLDELSSEKGTLDGFLDIDDVDAVALAVDVWTHLWVPS